MRQQRAWYNLPRPYISRSFLDNTEPINEDGLTRVAIILAYFGSDIDVRELREEDVVGYTRWRLVGGAQYGPATKNGSPTMRRCSP
jgi:hypothetical protein